LSAFLASEEGKDDHGGVLRCPWLCRLSANAHTCLSSIRNHRSRNSIRISLSINGNQQYTASLSGAGYLSAHLNVRNRPKENDLSAVVRMHATDTSQEAENVSMDWPAIPLHAGDVVELTLLPLGEGDPPTETRSSSEDPRNLFARAEKCRRTDQNCFRV